jgi:hypothetical protein
VQGLKWTQADLLQVMEELEPHAQAALRTYFLVRAGLNSCLAQVESQLRQWRLDLAPDAWADLYVGIDGLPSVTVAQVVTRATRLGAADPERLTILARCSHRGPGEMRPDAIRWDEANALLTYLAQQGEGRWQSMEAAQRRQAVAAALRTSLGNGRYREFEVLLRNAHELIRAVDVAYDALTMVMAAAQQWARAAAKETLAAGLLRQAGDVTYLELEELKQVATVEWHGGRSEEVQEMIYRRRSSPAGAPAPEVRGPGFTVVPGGCAGQLYCDSPAAVLPPASAVWLAESADPGCAPFWPHACAVQTTGADAWAPGMIAARGLGVPARAGVPAPAMAAPSMAAS